MLKTLGDFIANSLPASIFMGRLWVMPLSWSWRSQVLILGSRGYEPQGAWQSRVEWLLSAHPPASPLALLSQFCPRSASATSLMLSRCVDVVKGLLE